MYFLKTKKHSQPSTSPPSHQINSGWRKCESRRSSCQVVVRTIAGSLTAGVKLDSLLDVENGVLSGWALVFGQLSCHVSVLAVGLSKHGDASTRGTRMWNGEISKIQSSPAVRNGADFLVASQLQGKQPPLSVSPSLPIPYLDVARIYESW